MAARHTYKPTTMRSCSVIAGISTGAAPGLRSDLAQRNSCLVAFQSPRVDEPTLFDESMSYFGPQEHSDVFPALEIHNAENTVPPNQYPDAHVMDRPTTYPSNRT